MNGRLGRILGVAFLGAALTLPQSASAAEGNWDFICGGDTNFALCASVNITFTGYTDAGGTITMTVTNLSNSPLNPWSGPGIENTVFTKIGLFNLGSGVTVGSVGPLQAGFNPTGWTSTTSLDNSGGQALVFGVDTQGSQNGIPVDVTKVFKFTITGTGLNTFAANLDAENVGLSIHGQSGVEGNSTTCLTDGKNANCDLITTTVPEPTTLLLVGTGMAGLAAIRRRREGQIEEEE